MSRSPPPRAPEPATPAASVSVAVSVSVSVSVAATAAAAAALSRARHVVWDWNGTLLDDHEHCVVVLNGMLDDHRLPLVDARRYRDHFDFPVRGYYERLGFDLDDDQWERLAARFIEDYDRGAGQCRLHDGALDLLDLLGRKGVRSSILSAARTASLETSLTERGIRGLFQDVVGLEDHYAGGKVERGLEWIESHRAAAHEMVLIGDTVHDFEVASAMGVRSILVAAGHHARERLERCDCPVVGGLGELLALLD